MGTLFLAVAISFITWTSNHVPPVLNISQPGVQSTATAVSTATPQETRRIEWRSAIKWFRWFSPAIGLSQGVADWVTWYRRIFQER